MSYFLYILKSFSTDKFYVGISANPELLLSYHNSFEKGFTSRYRPWKIIFNKSPYAKVIIMSFRPDESGLESVLRRLLDAERQCHQHDNCVR
ncbi:MAG: GIY-YIG nuclease family protein [Ignavibacteriales bacterium]|nr:GIY-YIG nuclease family protein [Ignavibacteriales bacterium]